VAQKPRPGGPSKTDLEMLAVLWEKGEATGRDVYHALEKRGVIRSGVAYTTVKTYLDRLVLKGYATAEEAGGGDGRGTYTYRPAVTQAQLREQPGFLDRIVSALGMGLPEFATWFMRQGKLTRRDREEVEKILRKIK